MAGEGKGELGVRGDRGFGRPLEEKKSNSAQMPKGFVPFSISKRHRRIKKKRRSHIKRKERNLVDRERNAYEGPRDHLSGIFIKRKNYKAEKGAK